jgi:hypothetical protein
MRKTPGFLYSFASADPVGENLGSVWRGHRARNVSLAASQNGRYGEGQATRQNGSFWPDSLAA